MRDVVAHHIFHIPSRNQYSDNRIYEIQIIAADKVHLAGEHMRNEMNQRLEKQCGKSAAYPHDESKHQHKGFFLYMALPPQHKPQHQVVEPAGLLFGRQRGIRNCCFRHKNYLPRPLNTVLTVYISIFISVVRDMFSIYMRSYLSLSTISSTVEA